MDNTTMNGTNGHYHNGTHVITEDMTEMYILPTMITIGVLGNIFTLILFCRGKQKSLSVSVYMCAYCFGNLSNLLLNYGMHLLTVISGLPEISNMSSWGCSLFMFTTCMVQYCSIWFVVGMTVDRYIASCYPASAITMCTNFMAKVAVGIIIIGLIVVSVHAMWIFDLNNHGQCIVNMDISGNDDIKRSDMLDEKHLHITIWTYQSAIAYAYLPLLILLVLDILLIFGLCFQHSSSSTSSQENVSTEYTNTVVAISVSYFTFSLPMTIVNIVNMVELSLMDYISFFDYIQRINLIDSFFICLLFSRSFRHEIRNICRQLRVRRQCTLEMNRFSNKSLLTHEVVTTPATAEEDTLI